MAPTKWCSATWRRGPTYSSRPSRPGCSTLPAWGTANSSALNPRLIYTSVTGFGRQGPYADAPLDEGLVHAKLGVFKTFQRMSPHTDPPYVNVPFASFAACQVALHGTLTALIERERSGLGQWVETNLAQAFATLDTWAWFEHLIAERWPDAFTKSNAYDAEGRPASPLTFMLLVCLTKDGTWLQFAAVAAHLFAAQMKSLGLAWMFTDENWKGLPVFGDDADKRMALWTAMIEASRSKTLAEWEQIFEADPNVFAEQFRNGPQALDHPQLIHDDLVVTVNDTERGPVRQPGAIVKAAETPADLRVSAPLLDQHRAEILALAAASTAPSASPSPRSDPALGGLPLAGVTVLELATMFAGPHGTTMLTDLGATVIKVEPLTGDNIRRILPFPESGGAKVMQGKESIAVDLSTDEGKALVQGLAATVDVVIQGYRAGAMSKLGLDYPSVRVGNPNVVYVNAPGYGVDGPYGSKPAYAPSIGAASGIPLANVGLTVPQRDDLTTAQIQDGARRLSAASAMSNAQADGFAALGVTTAILFGLVARDRGAGGQELFSSMLNTGSHAMSAQAVTYPGSPPEPAPAADLRGLGPRHRIYRRVRRLCISGRIGAGRLRSARGGRRPLRRSYRGGRRCRGDDLDLELDVRDQDGRGVGTGVTRPGRWLRGGQYGVDRVDHVRSGVRTGQRLSQRRGSPDVRRPSPARSVRPVLPVADASVGRGPGRPTHRPDPGATGQDRG